MDHNLKLLAALIFSLSCLDLVQAEFLSPLADSKTYGCSLQNKVHKVAINAQSQALSAKALKALTNKLKKEKSKSGKTKAQKKKIKAAKELLSAINKCKSGKLKHLDPCAELNLLATKEQVSSKLFNSRICDWKNSAIVKVISTFIDDTQEQCSGAAVSAHVVLTAQHCVFDSNGQAPTKVEVYLENLEIREPDDIYADPTFFDSGASDLARYDIAALAFIDALPITAPLSLLPKSTKIQLEERALLVGFGRDELGTPPGFDLMAGFLRVKKDNSYSVALKYSGYPGESGPCTGDSGGPLLIERSGKWHLAGVASYNDNLANPCSAPSSSYYTKYTDCDVLDLFADLLCSAPYHNLQDGECIFNACSSGAKLGR